MYIFFGRCYGDFIIYMYIFENSSLANNFFTTSTTLLVLQMYVYCFCPYVIFLQNVHTCICTLEDMWIFRPYNFITNAFS